jgi:SAM-dependent methyltransferase
VDGKGRNCKDVLVAIDEETEVACGFDRLTRVFPATTAAALVLVVADTLEFRHLARTQVCAADSVLEIGCSTGLTTTILQSQAGSSIGFDISTSQIDEARRNHPDCTFEYLDIFADTDRLSGYPKSCQCNVAFIDINGDREVSQVLQAVSLLREKYVAPLRLIAIKSEELFAAMSTWGFDGCQISSQSLRRHQ